MKRRLPWIFRCAAASLFLCGMASVPAQSRARRAAPAPSPQSSPSTRHYNPFRAVHDVSVGKFYLDQGDLDGAIARFKDAIRYKPHYAEPRLYLGEAYEKKHDSRRAIRYYEQYLKILPDTKESRKVRKRIAKIRKEIRKENSAGRPDQE